MPQLAVLLDLATKQRILGILPFSIAAPPLDRRGLHKSVLMESATSRDKGPGTPGTQTVQRTKERAENA